jgi:GTP-binding protein
MYDWIVSNGYHPIIIATKMDKLNRSQIPKHVKMVREGLCMEKDGVIIPFSAETKQGRDEIWDFIEHEIGKLEAEQGIMDAANENHAQS